MIKKLFNNRYLWIILVWVLALVLFIFISSDIVFKFPPSITLEHLGQIGDSFNMLTSLFAGLAFAAVLISINLQKKELKESRQEFSLQRKSMELQQFDNKFFQMLGVFNDVIKNIKSFSDSHKNGGNMLFQEIREKLLDKFKSIPLEDFIPEYNIFNDKYNLSLKYYFLNLYQVINYIDKSEVLSNESKKEYTNIIRAQLSKDELVLLFYNCIGISNISGNRYKELVEKYNFFEHVAYDDLIYEFQPWNRETGEENGVPITNKKLTDYLINSYNKKAFGDNVDPRLNGKH